MSEELKPCPWQKEGELHWSRVVEAMGESWVLCICGVAGPMCATKEQAIERWNTRHERTCHVIIEDECPVCSGCDEDIDPSWVACPNCGAKVVG